MKKTEMKIVGWNEWLSLPELNIPAIRAKVDTGAKTSAIHAFSIEEPFLKDGKKWIRFGVHPLQDRADIEIWCECQLVDEREVVNSGGQGEERYVIKTPVAMGDDKWEIEITLTNRDNLSYRMLLGREALRGKFVVDPFQNCVHGEVEDSIYDELQNSGDYPSILNIGILSREQNCYSTRSLVEAIKRKGHNPVLIDTLRCTMKIASKRPEILYQGKRLKNIHAIIPRVGASVTFYGMAVVRQFEMMNIFTLNRSVAIGCSRDKLHAHQLMARKGIDMPLTAFAHSPEDTGEIMNIIGDFPMILKLLEGTQGQGVVLAESRKAAQSTIDAFRGLKANILVQEFIQESKGEDIRCIVLGDKVVAAMKRRAQEGDFRSNLHQGGKAELVKITPKERQTAVKAAKALGLRFAGVDLLRATSGPKIIEVNSSPGLEGIEKSTGKDIAGMVIDYLLRNLPKSFSGI